jgi:hypothetical protein
MPLEDDEFRASLRDIVERSGLSMRALSHAMGRDPGYLAALLDPTRPSRARPTPADLVAGSDATGIPFIELLELLWGIERSRLVDELVRFSVSDANDRRLDQLPGADRREIGQFIDFVIARRARRRGDMSD